jgi:Zn-dependent peptidase ImmA (M78 family)
MNGPSRPERRAIEILDELGIRELPIPAEEIARRLGAQLTYEAFDGDVSGMLYRDGEARPAVIGVNSRQAPTRQRFTVAHEIGHLVLHKGQAVFVDSFVRVNWRAGKSGRDEVEANAFAAELLMPRQFIERQIDAAVSRHKTLRREALIAELANKFKVSSEAMSYRLSNLGVLDPHSLTG